MSNYSASPNDCRVDFFKPSGKWYSTESIEFHSNDYHSHPSDALKIALLKHLNGRMSGMTAVCLHPYVENQFPVMVQL